MTNFEIAVLALLGVITLIHVAAVVAGVFVARRLLAEHARLRPTIETQVQQLHSLQTQVTQFGTQLAAIRDRWSSLGESVKAAPVAAVNKVKELVQRVKPDEAETSIEATIAVQATTEEAR